MEVNTRIQVEHTVTEELTGIDLVREQIKIAMGEKLKFKQKDIEFKGHVIQFRINAENPSNNFAPSPGLLEYYIPPGGPHVRVDSACYSGYRIPPNYDSMIAKLIVKGKDREEAIAIAKRALKEFHIGGVHSTIPFHLYMFEDSRFLNNEYFIGYVDQWILKAVILLSIKSIKMSSLELLISESEIKLKLQEISTKLQSDYQGQEVTIVMVMKSAFFLAADLMRLLQFPTTLEFITASSYGSGGIERGALTVTGLDDIVVTDKHILIVDDIFHSGLTLFHIVSELKKHKPKTLRSLVLLFKELPRDIDYIPDYSLFKIGNPFVVGYGMDYKELYRGLPGIYSYHSEGRP